jgi:hypothetical protein
MLESSKLVDLGSTATRRGPSTSDVDDDEVDEEANTTASSLSIKSDDITDLRRKADEALELIVSAESN